MGYTSWSVVFGEQPSAAKWNILGTNDASFNDGTGIANMELGSGHTALKNDYKFSAYRNGAATIATSATVIVFETELFDTGSNHNVSTGTFTAPISGFYLFCAGVMAAATASVTALIVMLYVNGAEKHRFGYHGNVNAANAAASGAALVQLAATDTVNVYGQSTGATANLSVGSSSRTWWTGMLISTT